MMASTVECATETKRDSTDITKKANKTEMDGKRTHPDEKDGLKTTEAKSRKKQKRISNKRVDPSVLKVRRSIQQCCASNDLATAMEHYNVAIQQEIKIEAQSFYNLLNLCSGLGDRGVHVGTPKAHAVESLKQEQSLCGLIRAVSPETRKEYAYSIKRRMDELQLPLNETAYSALIRMVSKEHDVVEGAKLLTEAEGVSQCKPRLRMYSPLLIAYCELGSMIPALGLWGRLSQRNLTMTEKEYAALIQCATKKQDAQVMERVLSDLAEDVLVPSHDTLRSITDWFESPGAHHHQQQESTLQMCVSRPLSLHGVELPQSDAPSMGPVMCPPDQRWIISHSCQIDSTTGVLTSGCMKGEKLQPISLSPATWDDMRRMNETIVLDGMLKEDTSQFQGGGKGRKRRPHNDDARMKKQKKHNWERFQQYLNSRRPTPIDVVIDGANVGYCDQNFAHAPKHVDYRQIDWVVQHCRRHLMGDTKSSSSSSSSSILLVLHERHFSPRLLPTWAEPIVDSWSDVLYKANAGMNDDWFWLHAALTFRSKWVVTNDEMRDHFFQMLAPRSFVRWKERHQVRFSFGEWTKDDHDGTNQREVRLVPPDPYSRRIQRLLPSSLEEEGSSSGAVVGGGLVIPLAKRGDEGRFLDGSHVAEDDAPVEETYVCIGSTTSV